VQAVNQVALRKADSLMTRGLHEGLFTGAALTVTFKGETFLHKSYGTVGGPVTVPVTQETLFDLASLTKVTATTPCWMNLAAQSPGILDRPLERWFPNVPADKRAITPRLLLAHASGLPHWRPYYLMSWPVPAAEQFGMTILEEPLLYEPGKGCLYTDLGFVLLALVLDLETGMPLDVLATERIYEPLGLSSELMFKPDGDKNSIALTRPGEPPGLVHDLNARTLGGVAGHAGLFGTARGVAALARRLIQSAHADSNRGVYQEFFKRAGFTKDSTRALGFDTPSPEGSASGRLFSPDTIGHTGFTGTSLWIDLQREVIVVLLTNRVFMGESDVRIRTFRPQVHDAVMEELLSR